MGRLQGTVKFFNTQKGYGFIQAGNNAEEPGESGQEYFVHFSAISGDGFKSLAAGEAVEFELETNPATLKRCAVRVSGPDGNPVQGAPPQTTKGVGKGFKGGYGDGGKGYGDGGKGYDGNAKGKKGGKGKGKKGGKEKGYGGFEDWFSGGGAFGGYGGYAGGYGGGFDGCGGCGCYPGAGFGGGCAGAGGYCSGGFAPNPYLGSGFPGACGAGPYGGQAYS